MSEKNKRSLRRILLATLGFLLVFGVVKATQPSLPVRATLYATPYLIAGYDVLGKVVLKISEEKVFSEHFSMAIATLRAFVLSFMVNESEFAEAILVVVLYQVGELFKHIAGGSSGKSITELLNLRPDLIHLEEGDGVVNIDPQEVQEGQIISIHPEEKVAIDGILIAGEFSVDTAALTDESLSQMVQVGDQVFSGMISTTGVIRVKVLHSVKGSALSKILDLLESSATNKSKSEYFVTRFAAVYTPTVVTATVVLAVLPPLVSGDFAGSFPEWFNRILTFLVIPCPCALVISIPLSFLGGLGAYSKAGVLVRGSDCSESLASLESLLFDKTGALAGGVFKVTALHPNGTTNEQLLHLASHVEHFSTHPVARSLREAYKKEADDCPTTDMTEKSGYGISAIINGRNVATGNTKFMGSLEAKWKTCSEVGAIIHVAIDGACAGRIMVSDCIKSDTEGTLGQFKQAGVKYLVMLTGDRRAVAERIADGLGIIDYQAGSLPTDKVDEPGKYLAKKSPCITIGSVGDGINDVPVLARAGVGIATGGLGSDVAIEAADVVIVDGQLSKIAKAIKIAREAIRIAHENTIFSIGIKVLILLLANFGVANMWLAIFANVGVTTLATLNAMRTMTLT